MKAFADGSLMRPEAIRKVLVDHRNAWRVRLVGFEEASAAHDGNMHGFEIAVANRGIESGRRLFAASQRAAFRNHAFGVAAKTERDDRYKRSRPYARRRTRPIEKLLIELLVLRLVVMDHLRVEAHQEQMIGLKTWPLSQLASKPHENHG